MIFSMRYEKDHDNATLHSMLYHALDMKAMWIKCFKSIS